MMTVSPIDSILQCMALVALAVAAMPLMPVKGYGW